jgi:hypothetical protein
MDNQGSSVIDNNENVEKNEKIEVKLNKLQYPKRKYAIIHGYNGHNYCGNQK